MTVKFVSSYFKLHLFGHVFLSLLETRTHIHMLVTPYQFQKTRNTTTSVGQILHV